MLAVAVQDIKPVKFRIRNYKSIIDSGDCYFSESGVTILAGRNESGKTSILEALEYFSVEKILTDIKPININGDCETRIGVTFLFSTDYLKELIKDFGIVNSSALKEKSTEITVNRGINGYWLDNQFFSQLKIGYDYSEQRIKEYLDSLDNLLVYQNELVVPTTYNNFEELKDKIETLTNLINRGGSNSTNELNQNTVEACNVFLGKIAGIISDYSEEEQVIADISKKLYNSLPRFILFSSFGDTFPDSIPMSELKESKWAKNLAKVSNFDIQSIVESTDSQARRKHELEFNVDFKKDFDDFWHQDPIKLEVNIDGDAIFFHILEEDVPYKPSQRSKGFQWYLSFYIEIVAKIKDENSVILIDEPGLYLHAKAQGDLLDVLQGHSSDYPIVFSTHSPYLINESILDSVQLVRKSKQEGSKIIGKIHSCSDADEETLTPIMTAIGVGMNDSIVDVNKQHNVVVEGVSDTFYLRAFMELYGDATPIQFISGGGSKKMWRVGAILEGWGVDVMYLLDNDSGGDDGQKSLKSMGALPEFIKTVSDKNDTSIEDLFSEKDFKKYVLEDEDVDLKGAKNSAFFKGKGKGKGKDEGTDKVLKARHFLQKVKKQSKKEKVELDDKSKENIMKLLEKLAEAKGNGAAKKPPHP